MASPRFITHAFAGNPLDRAGDRRGDADWIAGRLETPGARVLVLWKGNPLLRPGAELVFIEGPASEIYSVALKSSPASLAAIEPLFSRIVDSWRLSDEAGEGNAAKPSAPNHRTRPNSKSPDPPKS